MNAVGRDFPSLKIFADRVEAIGAFAQAQARFLEPDLEDVAELEEKLRATSTGVVAHFYMDAELQGVLSACTHKHIHIADSLVMADRAVSMVKDGARQLAVLGVDFMSENVRALLDYEGFPKVPVYRLAKERIGCSLAEAADAPAYEAYLEQASREPRSLHVVYINTSLGLKAKAEAKLPTITCTSSNVVQTILQASAEMPGLSVWFGPDTYMGRNLHHMLQNFAKLDDTEIAHIHPAHSRASISALLEKFHYFEDGQCIVHHMFGEDVVQKVRENYQDASVAAHLEVPGEMFELAAELVGAGKGAVGSTSQILKFVNKKVEEACARGQEETVRVILGTESGMITAIKRSVQEILGRSPNNKVAAEIIFPTADNLLSQTEDATLPVVPGAAASEGCSTSGGCATCPYMKKNSLSSLLEVVDATADNQGAAKAYLAERPKALDSQVGSSVAELGHSIAELGQRPIIAMRHFQKTGTMAPSLLQRIAV